MIISGVVMPRHSPLMTRQGQLRADDVAEEERDDPPDWKKMKVGLYFKLTADMLTKIFTSIHILYALSNKLLMRTVSQKFLLVARNAVIHIHRSIA